MTPAWGQNRGGNDGTGPDVVVPDPAQGRIVGRMSGEKFWLQKTPPGAMPGVVGRDGKDKLMLLDDGQGTRMGRAGGRRLLCYTDAASGLTLCK